MVRAAVVPVVPVVAVPRCRRRRDGRPVAAAVLAATARVFVAAVAGLGGHDGGVLEVGGEVEVLQLLGEAARRRNLIGFEVYYL